MILKRIFYQICAFQWTKVKQLFGRVFYYFMSFGLNNGKIKVLKKISLFFLLQFFFQIEVQVTTNPSSRHEKTPNS